jgi:hypothetical protein
MLWDLDEGGRLCLVEAGDTINALVFSPNRYCIISLFGSSVLHGKIDSDERARVDVHGNFPTEECLHKPGLRASG